MHAWGFPGGSVVKNLPAKQETRVQLRGQEVSLEKETASHSSILAWEIPWTEEPGGATIHGVAKLDTTNNWAWPMHLSVDVFCTDTSEKAIATHSSTVAWKIPWMEEPGRLQSMGSLRVGHDWVTSLSLSTFMHWRGKWQPTPVFLPGESHGQRSLVGCGPWGRTESDTTEVT